MTNENLVGESINSQKYKHKACLPIYMIDYEFYSSGNESGNVYITQLAWTPNLRHKVVLL